MALIVPFNFSTRSSDASTTCATDTARVRISRCSSTAGESARSAFMNQGPSLCGLCELYVDRRSWLPVTGKRHDPRESGLAPFALPREAPKDQALVLQPGRIDVAAQVLDVHAVLREERVVGQLVR